MDRHIANIENLFSIFDELDNIPSKDIAGQFRLLLAICKKQFEILKEQGVQIAELEKLANQ